MAGPKVSIIKRFHCSTFMFHNSPPWLSSVHLHTHIVIYSHIPHTPHTPHPTHTLMITPTHTPTHTGRTYQLDGGHKTWVKCYIAAVQQGERTAATDPASCLFPTTNPCSHAAKAPWSSSAANAPYAANAPWSSNAPYAAKAPWSSSHAAKAPWSSNAAKAPWSSNAARAPWSSNAARAPRSSNAANAPWSSNAANAPWSPKAHSKFHRRA